MWKLKKLPQPQIDQYRDLFLSTLIKRRENKKVPPFIREYLPKDTLEELLVAPMPRLLEISALYKEYVPQVYDNPKILSNIFNYGYLISGNKPNSYRIASIIGQNTCVYCNRIYTHTVIEKSGNCVIRPVFDHWFAQSEHPLLGLSLYNLIPSCTFCNSNLKGKKDLTVGHIYPYDQFDGDYFKFQYTYNNSIDTYKVETIDISSPNAEKMLDAFKIREVYNAHANFELRNLVELHTKYAFSTDWLLDLMKQSGITAEDLQRYLFGISSQTLEYPLSKFKRDIIAQLDRVKKF